MKEKIVKLPYLYKKVGKQYFLSSEIGSWIVLDSQEFDIFKNYKKVEVPKELLKKLKEKFFLIDQEDVSSKKSIVKILKKKYKNATKGPGLFLVGVTKRCNLKCLYCHLSSCSIEKKSIKNKKEIIDGIVHFILETPKKNITIEFQGGEPLLEIDFIKDFIKIVKEKNKNYNKNIRFCLTTNLTLLKDSILDFLIKENISISTTVDGNKIAHDFCRPFRTDKGSYDIVTEKIKLLKKRNVKFGILTIITKKNIGKAKEIVDFFLKQNDNFIGVNKVQKLGRAYLSKNWEKIGITNKEFFDFWKNVIEYIFELHKKGIFVSERILDLVLEKLFYQEPNFVNWQNPGGDIISTLAFDDEGYIYPTDESRDIKSLRLGNILKDSYIDVLDKKISQNIIKASILDAQFCNYCAYKFMCGLCTDVSYKNSKEFFTRHFDDTSRCSLNMAIFDYIIKKIIDKPHEIKAALYVHKYIHEVKR